MQAYSPTPNNVRTMSALLAYRADQNADVTGYTFLDDGETVSGTLTFAELDQQAQQIAAGLRHRLQKNERVLLLFPPGLEFVRAFWACLYAGVVAVPLYPPRHNRVDSRIIDVTKDAAAAIALTTAEIAAEDHRATLGHVPLCSLDELIKSGETFREASVGGDSLAFLQYTSGSTSTPKGVMVSHANLLENLANMHEGWYHDSESVIVTWLPTFHDMGLIYGVLQPAFNGLRCVAMPPATFFRQPLRWLQAFTKYRGTHATAPNFAYEHCAVSISPEDREGLDLSSWVAAVNGSEPVRESTQRKFYEAFGPYGFRYDSFCPGFGLAEATLKATATHVGEPVASCVVDIAGLAENRVVEREPTTHDSRPEWASPTQTLIGCGPPSGTNRVLIVDPETRILCSPDGVGEIWMSGPTIAQGYWNRPQESQETFGATLADTGEGPFMRTGDLGFWRNGHLFVTGRIKDVIIQNGVNVYPQDIEHTVERSHVAIRPSTGAAFSVEVGDQERVVLVQEVERSHVRTMNVDEVIGAIRRSVFAEHDISLYAVALVRPASILKTSSGKIQRRACKQAFVNGDLRIVAQWQADSAAAENLELVEELAGLNATDRLARMIAYLRQLLSGHLNCRPEEIGLRDRLVELGIESTSAVEISIQLHEDLGPAVTSTVIFDYPT
ncbi:MAG: AMP-binding protein, partial [Planctomycetota bacterium]|nr:AMP-binding protein [Planctomycetota bacterium]